MCIMIVLWQCAFEEYDHNWVNGDIVGIWSSCTWAVYVYCGNEYLLKERWQTRLTQGQAIIFVHIDEIGVFVSW